MIRSFKSRLQSIGFRQLDGFIDCSSSSYRTRYKVNREKLMLLVELRKKCDEGGGPKAVRRHTQDLGKLLARERLRLLLDEQSPWLELGTLAGFGSDYGDVPGAGTVVGVGRVAGELCVVFANDATIKGGTLYPISVKKHLRGQELAHQLRLPCIYLVDSGGAFLPLQSEIFPDKEHGGKTFFNEAVMGAEGIAQIAVICGNCTAGGAYTPTMTDDVVMVTRVGSMFLGGPPLVRAATGELISAEELGGATLHTTTSGGADYFAETEADAFTAVRDVVDCVSSVRRESVEESAALRPVYSLVELDGIAGSPTPDRSVVDQILSRVLDRSEFFEFRERYGTGVVCGRGRLGGLLVGVVAAVGQGVCARSAQKASQFIQSCQLHRLPLFIFQRSLLSAENYCSSFEDLKAQAQMISVLSTATVPKFVVNVGNCYGSDYFMFCGRSFGPTVYLSWPDAHIALEPPTDAASEREASAFHAASRLWVDAVIAPQDTRKVLLDCLRLLPSLIPTEHFQGSCIRM